MKKVLSILLVLCLLLTLGACGGTEDPAQPDETKDPVDQTPAESKTGGDETPKAGGAYPAMNINGIVQWGAGGGTDSLMRPLSALAEQELGVSIVIQNMTGATGSIATQFVYDAASDGYNLLMGAENPALYEKLDISDLTYSDFTCVFLIGDETVGIIVSKDSKYERFTDIIEDALANPGQIKLSTTGTGGLPWEVGAFITEITGATFNQIPYDSDASAKTAVMSGECDFTVCKVQSGIEDYLAGEIQFLTMLAVEPVETMPEVPLVTAEYPDFEKYLPWGPFYGIFVKSDTDPAIVETLSDAFSAVATDPSYQEVLESFSINYLGYTGDKAADFIDNWQSNTVEALEKSGALDDIAG